MGHSYIFPPGHVRSLVTDTVIPARNEQETIKDVVAAFKLADGIGQIIVVSDRSTDLTAQFAEQSGAIVIPGPGAGKGAAMMAGLAHVETDRVIFADADLRGFSPSHATALAKPCFGMLVGMRDKGYTGNALMTSSRYPTIAGERALPTWLMRQIRLTGYQAEMEINAAVVRAGLPIWHFIMESVSGKVKAGPLRTFDVLPALKPELLHYGKRVQWLDPIAARWPSHTKEQEIPMFTRGEHE